MRSSWGNAKEARRQAQRRYSKTPKGRAAAARKRLVWYEQRQVRLSPELRELRRTYWRLKKRCQRAGKDIRLSLLAQAVWTIMTDMAFWDPEEPEALAMLKQARRIAKDLDAEPELC